MSDYHDKLIRKLEVDKDALKGEIVWLNAEMRRYQELVSQSIHTERDLRTQLLARRPVMWRVMDDNVWRVFSDEGEARAEAERLGVDYRGLYVRDGT